MPLNQQEHGDENWWTLSEGWPETRQWAELKWVFANKSKLIPYGSYVLDSKNGILRVENKEHLKLLNENFSIVYREIRKKILNEVGIMPKHDMIYDTL